MTQKPNGYFLAMSRHLIITLLALTTLFLWSLQIAIYDLKFHLISNFAICLGFLLIWPTFLYLHMGYTFNNSRLLTALLVTILGFFNLFGMGDVKLFMIFLPWLNSENWARPILAALLIALLQICLARPIDQKFPKTIAFAPSLLVGVALNMAT